MTDFRDRANTRESRESNVACRCKRRPAELYPAAEHDGQKDNGVNNLIPGSEWHPGSVVREPSAVGSNESALESTFALLAFIGSRVAQVFIAENAIPPLRQYSACSSASGLDIGVTVLVSEVTQHSHISLGEVQLE